MDYHNPSSPSDPQNALTLADRGQLVRRRPRDDSGEYLGRLYADDDQERGSTGSLLQYWEILRRHKKLWSTVAVIMAVLGYLSTLPQTPGWEGQTSIEVLRENDDFMNLRQANSTSTDLEDDTSEVQSQISLLESRTVLKRTEEKLKNSYPRGTDRRKSLFNRIKLGCRKVLHLRLETADEEFADELDDIANSLKAKPDPQTRVVQITVHSFDPKLAAAFANTLTAEFIDQNTESRLGTTEKTSQWLGQQLEDMRKTLESSEIALQSYARSSGLIFAADGKNSISEQKLEEVQQALSVAEADRIMKESRYEDAQKSSPEALPEVLQDQGLRDTREKLTDLEKQESDLLTLFTPDYPKVMSIKAQIKALKSAFAHDEDAILRQIKNEYVEAARAEELLKARYFNQTKVVSGDGEKSIQYNILSGAVDSNRLLYQTMIQQLKQSTIASALRASTIRIVDAAEIPIKPYTPIPLLNTGIGLVAGIFFGAIFIIVREQADRTIQQPGDAPLSLNLPELGIIPSHQLELKALRGNPLQAHASRVELATWQRKPSDVAESFRSTLISILFSAQNGSSPHVLVVTSSDPAEGKSTVASNLAIAMAEVDMKTLLIDADLRKPRLHQIFDLDNRRGLSSLLHEKGTLNLNGDRSLNGVIRESAVPGLFVLTSGPSISTATNLLYGPHMPELLNYLRKNYDAILIDTPPMGQIPDARVVGRIADSVILIVRAGQTPRSVALAACQRFAEDGTKILGTILNDWNPKNSPSGYYRYKSYYKSHKYYHPPPKEG